jgi:hypothetical protein
MAVKDLTPTTVANIKVFISLFYYYEPALISQARRDAYNRSKVGGQGTYSSSGTLTGGQERLQLWFDQYIKPTAPAAGTATFSNTFTSIADYQNNFYIIRVALIGALVDPKVVEALDAWWKSLTISVRFYPNK